MKPSDPALAIVMIILAALVLSLMDAGTKYLSALLPVAIVLWSRYLIQAVVMACTVGRQTGRSGFRTRHFRFQLLRGGMLVILSGLGFFSLRHMPLAEFTAIIMLSPILVTALSSWRSGHSLGVLRWTLLMGGFAGTLIVIRPGSGLFGAAALLPLLGAAFATAYNLITSHLAVLEAPETTQFYTGFIGVALLSPVVYLQSDELLSALGALHMLEVCILLAVGLLGTGGHLLLIMAFRRASAASLMPFTYTQIAFAAGTGWVFFHHAPDSWAWTGMALIAACSCASAWVHMRRPRVTE